MEEIKKNLYIKSDGTIHNTHVFIDEVEVNGVVSIKWEFDTNMNFPLAVIKVFPNEVKLESTEVIIDAGDKNKIH